MLFKMCFLYFFVTCLFKTVFNILFQNGFRKMVRKKFDKNMGCVGFWKSYVIVRVGHGKCLRPLTKWVDWLKKGQKHAYVIFEWSLMLIIDRIKWVCHFLKKMEAYLTLPIVLCSKQYTFVFMNLSYFQTPPPPTSRRRRTPLLWVFYAGKK